jgi:hypothetical protein
MAKTWTCSDCNATVHLHPDPHHESHGWHREFLARHDQLHSEQLADHNGDKESLAMWLQNPKTHHAMKIAKNEKGTEEE